MTRWVACLSIAAVYAALAVAVACEPVPDIHFVSDGGGSVDGSGVDGPAGGDAARPDGASTSSGGVDAGCPPIGDDGGVCCGTRWCFEQAVGDCAASCGECERSCALGDLCCAKAGGNVVCKQKCP